MILVVFRKAFDGPFWRCCGLMFLVFYQVRGFNNFQGRGLNNDDAHKNRAGKRKEKRKTNEKVKKEEKWHL